MYITSAAKRHFELLKARKVKILRVHWHRNSSNVIGVMNGLSCKSHVGTRDNRVGKSNLLPIHYLEKFAIFRTEMRQTIFFRTERSLLTHENELKFPHFKGNISLNTVC